MPRYKLIIEFDGTDFSGWQIQPDARTVEGEIEKAMSKILQQPVDIVGQGRTDSGVHAKGQVAHVDLPGSINPDKFLFGVNGLVGEEIRIHDMVEVHSEFHARFDATSREYEYTILKIPSPLKNRTTWWPCRNVDFQIMKECVQILKGEFDFSGFSKFNEENYTTLCTILNAELEEVEDEVIFKIQANRFLRNMVRRLVGTLVEVGKGKLSREDFKEKLEKPEASVTTKTAPAKGLVLSNVFY